MLNNDNSQIFEYDGKCIMVSVNGKKCPTNVVKVLAKCGVYTCWKCLEAYLATKTEEDATMLRELVKTTQQQEEEQRFAALAAAQQKADEYFAQQQVIIYQCFCLRLTVNN